MLQFRQINTLVLTSSQSDLCLCCSLAAKSSFLAAISHNMNFKRILFLNQTVEIAFTPTAKFFLKIAEDICLLAVLLGSS